MEATEANSVFVIGPIGSKFAAYGSPAREVYETALEVYEKVILPACEKFSLSPVRADQIAATGEINEQIFRHLRDDDVVIADLTGANPNVMYELGLRHTRPKLTVQLGEFGQLPFDVLAVRTIQFSRSERGLIEARKELEAALDVGLAGAGDPVTATRVWLGAAGAADNDESPRRSQKQQADTEAVDQDGFIERIANIEQSFPFLSDTTNSVVEILTTMGAIANEYTTKIHNAMTVELPTVQRIALVDEFAQALLPSAQRLAEATDTFDHKMRDVDSEVSAILNFMESWPSEVDSFDEFLDSLVSTASSSREAMSGLSQFEASVTPLALLSRSLRQPVTLIQTSVRKMLDAILLVDEWENTVNRVRKEVE
ncbi:hypothetical protein [Curtobacterium sp. MCLR17_034]|uniref:hypothetical protein n=1 Tax=Curtobacterium sp. MCLR17_034 TaxID=2175623 RepID=UPI0011B37E9D|nr:hypothetical protein [Curtobacterium sp. MCLR17_034]